MSNDIEFDRAVIETEELDATHNEDLRELVEEWRERAENAAWEAKHTDDGELEQKCWSTVSHHELRADELEEVIEE